MKMMMMMIMMIMVMAGRDGSHEDDNDGGSKNGNHGDGKLMKACLSCIFPNFWLQLLDRTLQRFR